LFKTLVLRPALQPFINAVTGNIQTADTGGGGGGGGGGGMMGNVGTFANLMGSASAFGTGMAAGFTNALTGTFAGSMQAAGALIGTGTAQGVAAGLGMGIGTVAPYVLAAIVAYEFLFGEELESAGIRGKLKPTGFKGANFEEYSGGLLSGDRTETSPLNIKTQVYFDSVNKALREATSVAAQTLGGFAKSIEDFEYKIEINLLGKKTEESRKKAIEASFNKFDEQLAKITLRDLARGELFEAVKKSLIDVYLMKGAELAIAYESASKTVLGLFQFTRDGKKLNERVGITEAQITAYIDTFKKVGETSKETLTRLSQSISSVNSIFNILSLSMVDASLSGANLASKIVDAFGGIEKFTEQTGYYYEAFYSEQEKTAKTTETLTAAFAKINLSLPSTRQEFVSIIDSLDLTTEKGRETFAMLMMLAPAFASISESIKSIDVIAEEMRQATIEAAQTASNTALVILEQAIGKQKEAAQIARDAAQEQVNSIKSLFDYLGTEIDSLRDGAGGMTSAAGVAFIDAAIATAKATGYLPEANELSNAIAAVKRGLDSGKIAIDTAIQTAQATSNAALVILEQTIGKQKEAAEIARDAAQEQVNSIKSLFDYLGTEIDSLRGVAGGMTSAAGVAFIDAAIATAKASGYLPEANELSNAITAAKTGLDSGKFATEFDYKVAQASLANRLTELQAEASKQLTSAEKLLEFQNSSLIKLDAQLTTARDQLNSIRELTSPILSVEDAVNNMNTAIATEIKALSNVVDSATGLDSADLAKKLTELQAEAGKQLTSAEKLVEIQDSALIKLDGQLTTARDQLNSIRELTLPIMTVESAVNNMNTAIATEIKALSASLDSYKTGLVSRVSAASISGGTSAETAAVIKAVTPVRSFSLVEAVNYLKSQNVPYGAQAGSTLRTTQDIANFLDANILSSGGKTIATPKFADGGLFGGGMRLVGEEGPELEVTGPARYFSAPTTASMLGGSSDVALELRSLREENSAQSRAMVTLQNRMTKLLERWDGDGLPETRVVA